MSASEQAQQLGCNVPAGFPSRNIERSRLVGRRKPCVMMVQSDGELREMIRRMFRRADIFCVEACDAEAAMALADLAPIDAILLDLSPSRDGKKPDFDGWRAIRAHAANLPIVLLTTDTCAALPPGLSRDPMTRALCKPFGVKALLGVLFNLIDARELQQ